MKQPASSPCKRSAPFARTRRRGGERSAPERWSMNNFNSRKTKSINWNKLISISHTATFATDPFLLYDKQINYIIRTELVEEYEIRIWRKFKKIQLSIDGRALCSRISLEYQDHPEPDNWTNWTKTIWNLSYQPSTHLLLVLGVAAERRTGLLDRLGQLLAQSRLDVLDVLREEARQLKWGQII